MTMKDKDPRTFRERSPHFQVDVLGKSDDYFHPFHQQMSN
jgi:hypothetical protein